MTVSELFLTQNWSQPPSYLVLMNEIWYLGRPRTKQNANVVRCVSDDLWDAAEEQDAAVNQLVSQNAWCVCKNTEVELVPSERHPDVNLNGSQFRGAYIEL